MQQTRVRPEELPESGPWRLKGQDTCLERPSRHQSKYYTTASSQHQEEGSGKSSQLLNFDPLYGRGMHQYLGKMGVGPCRFAEKKKGDCYKI